MARVTLWHRFSTRRAMRSMCTCMSGSGLRGRTSSRKYVVGHLANQQSDHQRANYGKPVCHLARSLFAPRSRESRANENRSPKAAITRRRDTHKHSTPSQPSYHTNNSRSHAAAAQVVSAAADIQNGKNVLVGQGQLFAQTVKMSRAGSAMVTARQPRNIREAHI